MNHISDFMIPLRFGIRFCMLPGQLGIVVCGNWHALHVKGYLESTALRWKSLLFICIPLHGALWKALESQRRKRHQEKPAEFVHDLSGSSDVVFFVHSMVKWCTVQYIIWLCKMCFDFEVVKSWKQNGVHLHLCSWKHSGSCELAHFLAVSQVLHFTDN